MKRYFFKSAFLLSVMMAQSNVATTSGSFLEIGAGARSLSMGSAFVAVSKENPAEAGFPFNLSDVK